jgi:hypothetical protein
VGAGIFGVIAVVIALCALVSLALFMPETDEGTGHADTGSDETDEVSALA